MVNAYLNAVKTPDALQSNGAFSFPPDRDFIKTVETLVSGAFLLGLFHAAEEQEKEDGRINAGDYDIPPIPFAEAVNFLKSKVPMTKDEWLSLEKKMRFRAFTMAKLGEVKVIETVKKQLVKAMEGGEGFAQSFDTIKAIAKASDATLTPFYWETVFRTNVQGAYVAGKLMQYQKFPPAAYQLLVIEDVRTSDICRHLLTQSGYGVVLPVEHQFWKKYGFPPYHMNFRTGICAVYKSQIGEDGNNVENRSMKSFEKFKVQKGFGGNPIEKESWWKLTPSMIERADKYGITADIVAQARELDMQSYFPELLKGYESVYQSASGGYVQKAVNSDHNPDELTAANRLADLGHKIYLLPRSYSASSPDMIIDDEIGEIKNIDSIKYGTIREHIRKSGEKQRGRIVYICIKKQKQRDRVFKVIGEEIQNLPLKTLLLDYDGTITTYDRSYFIK